METMAKMDIFEKARKTGENIISRRNAKTKEMEQAAAAVTTAAAEMETAALAGNETEYARAKEKRAVAENRLEILQIRARKNANKEDSSAEITAALDEMKAACLAELRKIGGRFLEQYAEILVTIDTAMEYGKQYDGTQTYFKEVVMQDPNYHFQMMYEMFPLMKMDDFRKKFSYHISDIKKACNKE